MFFFPSDRRGKPLKKKKAKVGNAPPTFSNPEKRKSPLFPAHTDKETNKGKERDVVVPF